jgi:DNA polymerase-4
MSRTIIHIDVSDFPVAVERVLEPRLRQRPVIVAVQTATRSLVAALSREAADLGVQRGMPLPQARKYCHDLIVLPPNEELYSRATNALLTLLGRFSPVIEPLRFGHAYLDMTGSTRLFGTAVDAAARAQREIRDRLRLDAVAGVASNKLVSKVASDLLCRQRPQSPLCDVHHGEEKRFLSPLPVTCLPGVQNRVREQLGELNVRRVYDLALIQAEHLQMLFGRFGLLLFQRARGIDERPVQPVKKAPEIVEPLELAEDCNDFNHIRRLTFGLLARATRRLRQGDLRARGLSLEIRYSDYHEAAARVRIPPAQTDEELLTAATAALEKTLTRRVRVRKITLRLDGLAPASPQLELFSSAEPKRAALGRALDAIRDRYGENAIQFGRAAVPA